jgi:hypothetical protein
MRIQKTPVENHHAKLNSTKVFEANPDAMPRHQASLSQA